ncbi:hypothetical protein BDV19DRAFT_357674 [Aspergillus venezuelensis]
MSASELEQLLLFKDADTLAFIDSPSYKPNYSLRPSCVQSIGHRIHSQKLLATGSPVLTQLFDAKVQERNIKRRGGLPEGIKYIIDLTPPSTEDDAVLQLTELSCPLGIRTWAESFSRWELPAACVKGIDTIDNPAQNDRIHAIELPEYSPSRHRAGIVHILQLLEGSIPVLDTPCKLWTFFAVAKLYEIAAMPQISVRIMSWIYEGNNKRLIELHPEITYRIAKGIQCAHLLQDSFSVLVGEEALLLLRNSGAPPPKKQQVTVHGRPQEALDDDDVQRVQYAGESFLGHVLERFVELVGDEMRWLNDCPQLQTVLSCRFHSPDEDDIVQDLIDCLKAFLRNSILAVLDQHSWTWFPMSHKLLATGNYPTDDYFNVYSSLDLKERILSRTFWHNLRRKKFSDHDGTLFAVPIETTLANMGRSIAAFKNQHKATIREVTVVELRRRVKAFNALVYPLSQPDQRQFYFRDSRAPYDICNREFSIKDFLEEAEFYCAAFAKGMFASYWEEMKYDITDTLTYLTEKELKYLPLWAGGCDDGTGGVYAEQVPFAETDGFSAPGPSIHTGSAAPSEVPSIDSFLESTVHGASHRATEGVTSEVFSIDSGIMSESDNLSLADTADFQRVDIDSEPFTNADFRKVDDELSMALDSSADDDDDIFFDSDGASDSDDTVVLENADDSEISEFEELNLDEEREQRLPIREKDAVA